MFKYLILLGICLYCRHLINSNLVPQELTPFACEELSYSGEKVIPYQTCLTKAGTCTIKKKQCTYPKKQSDCLYGIVELEGKNSKGKTNNYCISKDLKQYQSKSWFSRLDFWLKFGLYGYMFFGVILPLIILIVIFIGAGAFLVMLGLSKQNKQNESNEPNESKENTSRESVKADSIKQQ